MTKLLALALLALSSCTVTKRIGLDTTWTGEAHPGVTSTLAFDPKGSARWTFDLPGGPEIYDVEYALDVDSKPAHLDFTGFTKGPFADKTLYGIASWNKDTLRLDVRPGDSGKGGDAVRPKDFTDQTRTFTRVW